MSPGTSKTKLCNLTSYCHALVGHDNAGSGPRSFNEEKVGRRGGQRKKGAAVLRKKKESKYLVNDYFKHLNSTSD